MVQSRAASRTSADMLADLIETGGIEGVAGPVTRFETHLSEILLAGDWAFKLKKPVRMPFVDFSTIERRHAACRAEVEINRRMGSPLYLGTFALARDADGRLHLDGEGEALDWVVTMKRFDTSQQLDQLADAGSFDTGLAVRTADRIAEMHAGLAPVLTAGHAADYRDVIRGLRKTEADGAERQGLKVGEHAPFDALDSALAHLDPLIERRRAGGKVRRTHGDLHLRNICVFEGEVTPFDALEFDERLATTDVLYDLAFLLMDMRHSGLRREANIVMNRYWDSSGETEEALALLPFFMALRASVRMAVAVEAGKLDEAQTYRALAFDLMKREKPLSVAIGGLSGTGKSTVAAEVAPYLPGAVGARLLRSDVLRKSGTGKSPEAARAAADAYSDDQRAEVYHALRDHAGAAVSSGASVLADATFKERSARDLIGTISGVHTQAFWLEAPREVRLSRVSGRHNDASDADVQVAAAQAEPDNLGPDWRSVDADRPVHAISRDILAQIAQADETAADGR